MADPTKTRRLEARIHQTIALTLGKAIKDPRLQDVTVAGVRLTGDWRDATVFYTVLGDESQAAAAATALAGATGTLRTALGRALSIRHTPSLTFVLDPLPERVDRIDQLLAEVRVADAEVARRARDAEFAGDPDPYIRPDEPEEPEASDESATASPDEEADPEGAPDHEPGDGR